MTVGSENNSKQNTQKIRSYLWDISPQKFIFGTNAFACRVLNSLLFFAEYGTKCFLSLHRKIAFALYKGDSLNKGQIISPEVMSSVHTI